MNKSRWLALFVCAISIVSIIVIGVDVGTGYLRGIVAQVEAAITGEEWLHVMGLFCRGLIGGIVIISGIIAASWLSYKAIE